MDHDYCAKEYASTTPSFCSSELSPKSDLSVKPQSSSGSPSEHDTGATDKIGAYFEYNSCNWKVIHIVIISFHTLGLYILSSYFWL